MFNKPAEKARINDPDPMSDIYISEGERFNKDFAAYDYEKRCRDHQKKKERYLTLQNILFDRERKRWEKMDYDYLRNENKIMMNKEKNLVGIKNNPGMAFNPITLQYDNSVQGEILKKRDEESKYRALMRASNIDKHANAGYNILNGEDRLIMQKRMQSEIDPNLYQQNIGAIQEMNKNQFSRYNKNNFYNNPGQNVNSYSAQNQIQPTPLMQPSPQPLIQSQPQPRSPYQISNQYSTAFNPMPCNPNEDYHRQITPYQDQRPPIENQPQYQRTPMQSPPQYPPQYQEPYPQQLPHQGINYGPNGTPYNNPGNRYPNEYGITKGPEVGYENSKNGYDMYNQNYQNIPQGQPMPNY